MADRDVEGGNLPLPQESDYTTYDPNVDFSFEEDGYAGLAPNNTFAQSVNAPVQSIYAPAQSVNIPAPKSHTTTLPNRFPEPETSFGRYVLALLGKAANKKPTTRKIRPWLDQPFEKRVAGFGIPNLFYYQESKAEVRVNFATLQKISLHQQQKDLVGLAGNIIRAQSIQGLEKTLRTSLQDYVTAVRDYKVMQDSAAAAAAGDLENDPFIVTTATSLGERLISEANDLGKPARWPREWPDKTNFLAPAKDRYHPMLPGGLRNRDNASRRRQAFIHRVGSALIGGIAFVGPMLLMMLHNTLVTRLVTASVSIFIFGLAYAFVQHTADPRDVMTAVAAYAAVLVIFVAASS